MEKSFKLSRTCELYKTFFETDTEKQKSHQLAKMFFKDSSLFTGIGKEQYIFRSQLTLTLNEEQITQFESSLMKNTLDGLYVFKKNSLLNQRWNEQVYSKINIKLIDKCKFWWMGCFSGNGSYSLWHHDNEVYGYLKSEGTIHLPDGAEEIKMSKYYQVMESLEDNKQ